jgi:putative endonuclease
MRGGLFYFNTLMIYSVYILYSFKLNRFYIGTSDDVQRRLLEHNNASFKDAFTSKGIPWILFLTIDGLSSESAYRIERHIKKMKSKSYIKNLKKYPEMISKLREV